MIRPLVRLPVVSTAAPPAGTTVGPATAKTAAGTVDALAASEMVSGLVPGPDHVTALANCVTSLANALVLQSAAHHGTRMPDNPDHAARQAEESALDEAGITQLPSAGSLAGLQDGRLSSGQTMSASLLRRLHQLAPSSAAKLTSTMQRQGLQLPTQAQQRTVRPWCCMLRPMAESPDHACLSPDAMHASHALHCACASV